MKQLLIMVCLSLYIGSAAGRLGKDAMRKALGSNPFFSHQRESAVPFRQNVNIRLPISDSDVQSTNDSPSNMRPVASRAQTSGRGPVASRAASRAQTSGRGPVASRAQTSGRGPVASGAQTSGRGIPVQQTTRITSVPAGRPSRQREIRLGQIKPTSVAQQQPSRVPAQVPLRVPARSQQSIVAAQPSRNTVNDRMLNNVRPAANIASADQQVAASKQECSFQIPSFLLPGPQSNNVDSSQNCPSFLVPGPNINRQLINEMVAHWTGIKKSSSSQLNEVRSQITQVEFEQKCLLPALSAHILGTCRSRELKIYLEWLLHLRQRLFNI